METILYIVPTNPDGRTARKIVKTNDGRRCTYNVVYIQLDTGYETTSSAWLPSRMLDLIFRVVGEQETLTHVPPSIGTPFVDAALT